MSSFLRRIPWRQRRGEGSPAAWQGPLAAGTTGTLANSQCTVNGIGTSASGLNQTLTLKLSVGATAAFAATQNIYMEAFDSEGSTSGWQNKGTWTPGP